MPESPEEIHARVVAAVGEDGRLHYTDMDDGLAAEYGKVSVWLADVATVAAKLATHGGRALV
jgi:hypothetical protein